MAHQNHPQDQSSDVEINQFLELMTVNELGEDTQEINYSQETKTAPIFTPSVRDLDPANFTQYALLGGQLQSSGQPLEKRKVPLLLNTNAPWSAFICGSQGSGKSYTLFCMLENCLLQNKKLGKLEKPMQVILFNYDKHNNGVPCEAAYLASKVPVKILLSPSNYTTMEPLYKNMPNSSNITIAPLLLNDQHLTIERMMSLMAVNAEKGTAPPLYIRAVKEILREMHMEDPKFKFSAFTQKLKFSNITSQQQPYLDIRMDLLKSFLPEGLKNKAGGSKILKDAKAYDSEYNMFNTKAGSLTIVDLTNPFMEASDACMLFEICLGIFLQQNANVPKVVALDEAHKFMTETIEAESFTARLQQVIREQRHIGARVLIATQEPTIDPSLLDLCSMTIVHRFRSPAWLHTLQEHLAGAAAIGDKENQRKKDIFEQIIKLNTGQGLLFCPDAMLDVEDGKAKKLEERIVKFRTRHRITEDGGKSVMAVK